MSYGQSRIKVLSETEQNWQEISPVLFLERKN